LAKLGVSAVLEGSVRKSGNRVRISARLVNRQRLRPVVGQYDRELNDIFAFRTRSQRRSSAR
jgi:adenylate cyclase